MEIKLGGFKKFDIPISISPKDFFGVILPGAIVAYTVIKFGNTSWQNQLVESIETIDGDWERRIVFATASLILGYLLQIPAKGLNPLYDCTYLAWKRSDGNKQERTEYNKDTHQAYVLVKEHAPKKAAPIEKLQSISEFFRSLTVISIVVSAIMFWNSNFYPALAAFGFSLACYWLFCEKLWDATKSSWEAYAMIFPKPPKERHYSEIL